MTLPGHARILFALPCQLITRAGGAGASVSRVAVVVNGRSAQAAEADQISNCGNRSMVGSSGKVFLRYKGWVEYEKNYCPGGGAGRLCSC